MEKLNSIEISKFIKSLNEEQKLKLWIKTLLESYNVFPELIKVVDHIVELQATTLSFYQIENSGLHSALGQFERVIDLSERKRDLLNIFSLTKKMLSFLSGEDLELFKKKFIYKYTTDDLSNDFGLTIRTVYRRSEKCLEKIYLNSLKSKFTCRFIESQISDEFWLKDRFKRNAKNLMIRLKGKANL